MAQRFNIFQTALGTDPPPPSPSQWGGGGPPFPVGVGDYSSTHLLLPYTYQFVYQHQDQDFLRTPPQPQLQLQQYYYSNNNSGGGYINTRRSTYYHVQETRIGGNPIQLEEETVIFDGSVVHRQHQHARNRNRNRNQRAVNVGRRDGNENSNNNNNGLSEDQITKCLRVKKKLCRDDKGEEEESEVCAICLGDLYCQLENNHNGTNINNNNNNNIVGSLECKHEYHWDCIGRWLRVKNFCPLCKAVAFHQDDGSRN